jgi:hypothetical protein
MKTFEAGKSYYTRSLGDHNCIIRVAVASRTAKTIKTVDGKSFRVSFYNDAEFVRPWGSYSMCPIVSAENTKELKPDWHS